MDNQSLVATIAIDPSSIKVGIALLLVLLNGFFVAAEFALVKLRLARAEELAEEKGFQGRMLLHVRQHMDAYLSACQLGITAASLALGWIGEETFAALVRPLLGSVGIESERVVAGVAIATAFFIITFLHIVIGEQAPKSLAIRRSERVALWSATPLRVFYFIAFPVIWFLNQSSLLVLRLLRVDLESEHEGAYSADEIRQVLASSHLHGALGAVERDILARTLDLRELSVGDLMRPASEMMVLDLTASWPENLARIEQHGYSRYPAVEGDRDAVVGVILVKDLWAAQRGGATLADLRPLVREIAIVHRDTKAFELLKMFREGQPHFAVVDDDLGTTLGFVTMDHLIAAMVGDVQDEFRRANADWIRQPDGSWLGDGKLSLYSLELLLGHGIEVEEVDSVGGLVMWKLERVPEKGAKVGFPGFEVVVREMRGPRVAQVQVIPKP